MTNSLQPPLPSSPSDEQEGDHEQLIAGGQVMSVTDHLFELRNRIVKSLWAIVIFFTLGFIFANDMIKYVEGPLLEVLPKGQKVLHFTGALDVFMTNMKMAFLASLLLACPVWIYQFWKFFEPALYPRERQYILPFIIASIGMFFSGILFCYYMILPLTLEYLINMGMEVATPIITIKDYIHLLTLMALGFAIVFEIPVIIVLLGLLDIVTVQTLTESRRYVVVGILIVSAIVMPSPDPISQVALAIPVYGMFEVAIVVIRLIKKRQARG